MEGSRKFSETLLCCDCKKNLVTCARGNASMYCQRCYWRANSRARAAGKSYRYGQHCDGAERRERSPLPYWEWETFWQKPCAWCKSAVPTISIDRIDNSLDYDLDNCQSLCRACNILKGRQGNDATLAHMCYVAAQNPHIEPRQMPDHEVINGSNRMDGSSKSPLWRFPGDIE